MTTTRAAGHRSGVRDRTAIVAGLTLVVLLLIVLVLAGNDGVFTYSLDDAYIHLALARSLTAGHYGLNLSEYSSPSSSIIFPFLLMPFVALGVGEFASLAINTLVLLATAYRLHRWLAEDLRAGPRLASIVTLVLVLGLNLLPLVFTGMEHSLQILLGVLIVEGLWRAANGQRLRGSFWCALVVAPLVRYEMLAVSLPAIALVGHASRAWTRSVAAALILCLPIAAFSFFLTSRGLPWLPNSVLVHAGYTDVPSRGIAVVRDLARNLIGNADSHAGAELSMLALLAAAGAMRRRRRTGLALVAVFVLGAELALGQIGWRYEIWALVSVALLALAAWAPLDDLAATGSRIAVLLAVCAIAVMSLPYLRGIVLIPRTANDLYRQQYQMGRIAQQLGVRAIALNDVGLVSWLNPHVYVLDLVGLAAGEPLATRELSSADTAWMEHLADKRSAELVMLYPLWFRRVPANWIKLADLHLGRDPIVLGQSQVSIYTRDPAAVVSMRSRLRSFKDSLPPGVSLEVVP